MSMTIDTPRAHRAPTHLALPPLSGFSAARRKAPRPVPARPAKLRGPEPCPLSAEEVRRIVLETLG